MKTWTYAADTVPLEPAAFAVWLDEHWSEVDAWVEVNKDRSLGPVTRAPAVRPDSGHESDSPTTEQGRTR